MRYLTVYRRLEFNLCHIQLPLTSFLYCTLKFCFFFFFFFFFKDLSLVRVVCYARITYILRKLYIYNIYYMQFLSNDSDIFFAPPLFFILPFLRFHYLSWRVSHTIIKITFGMVISFLLFIPRYALNCSFLSTLSLERFASIKFLFFFFFSFNTLILWS